MIEILLGVDSFEFALYCWLAATLLNWAAFEIRAVRQLNRRGGHER